MFLIQSKPVHCHGSVGKMLHLIIKRFDTCSPTPHMLHRYPAPRITHHVCPKNVLRCSWLGLWFWVVISCEAFSRAGGNFGNCVSHFELWYCYHFLRFDGGGGRGKGESFGFLSFFSRFTSKRSCFSAAKNHTSISRYKSNSLLGRVFDSDMNGLVLNEYILG